MNHFKPLDFDSGPLVWIDCEMTGLNPSKDKILEVAVCVKFIAFHWELFKKGQLGPHYQWEIRARRSGN